MYRDNFGESLQRRLRGPALSEAIREYIKQYILERNLQAGALLPSEGQFAEELGVGRSSIREAVKSLQSLGIIEVRHGEGLYVRELNFDPVLEMLNYGIQFNLTTLRELFQIRLWLEAAVIGDAVKEIQPEDIARLEQILVEWEKRSRSSEPDSDLDEAFHITLYSVLNNQTLLNLFQVFWIVFKNVIETVLDPDFQQRDRMPTLKRHHKLLEAVRARDADLARAYLIEHFAGIDQMLQSYIDKGVS